MPDNPPPYVAPADRDDLIPWLDRNLPTYQQAIAAGADPSTQANPPGFGAFSLLTPLSDVAIASAAASLTTTDYLIPETGVHPSVQTAEDLALFAAIELVGDDAIFNPVFNPSFDPYRSDDDQVVDYPVRDDHALQPIGFFTPANFILSPVTDPEDFLAGDERLLYRALINNGVVQGLLSDDESEGTDGDGDFADDELESDSDSSEDSNQESFSPQQVAELQQIAEQVVNDYVAENQPEDDPISETTEFTEL